MISLINLLLKHAKMAGISDPRDYAIFQNKGYKGLYGGLGVKEIHARKGLKKSQKILDHMGSTELAANLFRATQTDEKLRRDHITGKKRLIKPILMLVKKFAKQSKIWEVLCLKIFRLQRKVLSRLKENNEI